MNRCVVIIPVYSVSPTDSEKASFRNTLSVLRMHDITVVTYRNCNTKEYDNICNNLNTSIKYEYFNEEYFASVHGYNDLCFSKSFYLRFAEYEYMLICQLDAWVFRDELNYWCDKNYDYIGAPIFYGYSSNRFSKKIMGIGNGGLSLRKISHALKITSAQKKRIFLKPRTIISIYLNTALTNEEFRKSTLRMIVLPFLIMAKCLGFHNTLNYYIRKHLNEDLVFGSWSTDAWGIKANIPVADEAIRFSFEVHPNFLFNKTNHQLPFGCHAFLKWEYDSFWCKHIKY